MQSILRPDGGYERLTQVTKGVWKAKKDGSNRLVLLEVQNGDEEKLSKQLDIFYSCSHQCILEFFSAWVSGSQINCVLEYAEGTLESLNLALSELEVKSILRAVLKALAAIHSAGVVHRQVQLDTVWITSAGLPKLGGLSLAERLPSERSLTQALHYSAWLPPDVLPGSGLFGVALSGLYEHHALGGALRLVHAACRVLHNHLDEPGLFRISANHTDMQKLRHGFACMHRARLYKMLEQRRSANSWNPSAADPAATALLDAAGPHATASLLVSFLMDLPEPLIVTELYDAVLASCESPAPSSELLSILKTLPQPHAVVLRHVLELLSAVAAHSAANKMTTQNLGIILGPALLRKAQSPSDTPESVLADAKRQSVAVAAMIDLQPQICEALDEDLTEAETELPADYGSVAPSIPSRPYGTEVDIWSVGMLARRLMGSGAQTVAAANTAAAAAGGCTVEAFVESCLQAEARPAAEALLKHPWLQGGENVKVSLPPSAPLQQDPQAQAAAEKLLSEADALLKQLRAAVKSSDAGASVLFNHCCSTYRQVLAAAGELPSLRQRAWFGLGRASVITGSLMEADERFRLAASACTQPDASVLRHRALTLYRMAKRPSSGAQPGPCLAESCRLFALSERLPPAPTARWLQRWARAVDLACAANAPDSFMSREAWYRAFVAAAVKPNATVNLKPLIGFAAHSNSVFSRPMMLLSELSVRGGTAEIRRVAYAQSASLAELLYSQTTQPNANLPLPSEQMKMIKAMKLSEAEVRRNYHAFLTAVSFGRQAEKVLLLGKLEPQKDENPNGPELLSDAHGDVICEDAPNETWESRFEGHDVIGRGGFATVYRCKRKVDGRVVAVKVITTGARNSLRAVLREAKLLRDLKHPNIVCFLGCVRLGAQGVMHVVMEFCDGGTLRSLCNSTPLSSEHAAFITREVLSGLKYLHSVNIIHRDIKCENILLHLNGDVKIADFGIAESWGADCQAVEDDAGRIMKACGTPRYMSPEILRAQPCGRKMDLFCVAAVLYEMMEGESPYADDTVVKACFLVATRGLPPIECTCSPQLKQFYRQISYLEPQKRLSAAQALQHPFIRSAGTREDIQQLFSIAFLTRSIADAGL